MKYNLLGKSTLNVSKICLGCMGFGDGSGSQNWAISQEKADEIIKTALDAGINFFDTANCYGNGSSEIVLGNALKKFAKREDVIIATKVYFNEGKLSKQAILKEIDKSLKRLQTTYIDLYIIHRFDYDTPIEETMEALHSLVKAKKVRILVHLPCMPINLLKCKISQDKKDIQNLFLCKTITIYCIVKKKEK